MVSAARQWDRRVDGACLTRDGSGRDAAIGIHGSGEARCASKAHDGGSAGGRWSRRLGLCFEGLLEDGAEAGEFVERSLTQLMRHVAADESGQFASCCHDGVFGSDRRVGDVFMLVENGGGNAGVAGVFHPDDPGAVVLERCAEDVAFATVLGESLAPVGFVVNKGFHSDGNEGSSVVVMGPVDVGVGGDLGEHVRLLQGKELAFGLRDGLAPQVAWE